MKTRVREKERFLLIYLLGFETRNYDNNNPSQNKGYDDSKEIF